MSKNLEKVELQADVYMTCLQHALSTENFEVMGLLIGNIDLEIAKISSVIILRRLDKKKDRVEISAEQLLAATEEAERLTNELQRPMRVLGWYHSHPHITVFPSHVDIRTQATYQTMDAGFVGLIFAVFTEDKESKEQEVVLTCFQSRCGEAVEIPLEIIRTNELGMACMNTMKELPKILVQEEEEMSAPCENNHDILAAIHNNAVRTRALAHITDIITKPLVTILQQRIDINEIRKNQLENQRKSLIKQIKQLK